VFPYDVDPLQFALNLEYIEAEFFLHAAYGVGLDQIAPNLTLGGPPPVGAMKANLDEVTWRVVAEFGLQEVGHLRFVKLLRYTSVTVRRYLTDRSKNCTLQQ
jgi:hypothetical protein